MFSFKNPFIRKDTSKAIISENLSEPDWSKVSLGIDDDGSDVYWNTLSAPHAVIIGRKGEGQTVLLNKIIAHCVKHAEKMSVVGITMHKVNIQNSEKYLPFVYGVASNLEESFKACRLAHDFMKENYRLMEEAGVPTINDLPNPPRFLFLMVEEASSLFRKFEDEQANQEINELKDEMKELLFGISKLGPAAGVQLVLANTQHNMAINTAEFWTDISTNIVTGIIQDSEWKHVSLRTDGGKDWNKFQLYRTDDEWKASEFSQWEVDTHKALLPAFQPSAKAK